MKLIKRLALVTISSLILPTFALASDGNPFEGWGFVKDDWQVVCDNTLTCRAAGYAEEGATSGPASMLLVAEPQVATPQAFVTLLALDDVFYESSDQSDSTTNIVSADSGQDMGKQELWLNDKNYGHLNYDDNKDRYELSAAQTKQVLQHARKNTKIELRVDGKSWVISDKGIAAVLLKLDEIQGRVGTPLALVSKESLNRQMPKKALPLPIIHAAYAYPLSQYVSYETDDNGDDPSKSSDSKYFAQVSKSQLATWQDKMTNWVKPTLDSEDNECAVFEDNYVPYDNDSGWSFLPIDSQHTLANHRCWLGAYNEGFGYWVIKNTQPSSPQLVTTSGNDYGQGKIWATYKDRGLGDCWNRAIWVWDGSKFVKSEDSSTGMCRGFAGGAWDLPNHVSEVIEYKEVLK